MFPKVEKDFFHVLCISSDEPFLLPLLPSAQKRLKVVLGLFSFAKHRCCHLINPALTKNVAIVVNLTKVISDRVGCHCPSSLSVMCQVSTNEHNTNAFSIYTVVKIDTITFVIEL